MEKARQGKFLGGKVTYGYTWNEETKQYETVECEADVVRLIFNLCIEGLSTQSIQERLNELGYLTPVDTKGYNHRRKSNRWARSTVRRVLSNSMYTGEFVRWMWKAVDKNVSYLRPKHEWITSKVPAIIDKAVFELAQEALKSRKSLSKRNAKRNYLLSGLIYCDSCGCKMTAKCYRDKGTGKERMYYMCWNGWMHHLGKDCPTKSVRVGEIEMLVWEEIKRLLRNPTLLKQAILQSWSIDSSDENIEDLTKLLENKETEEERLLDLYQTGRFDREKLDGRMEKLRIEREAIRKNIEALKNRNTRLRTINELRLVVSQPKFDGIWASKYTL
ncbi:MAG: recombinase family protein [Ignavibacteriales bacterium]